MSLKTILGTDLVKDSRADINDNFTYLDNKAQPPGGANTQIQFNDDGVFGGNAGLTFNKANGRLNIGSDFTLHPEFLDWGDASSFVYIDNQNFLTTVSDTIEFNFGTGNRFLMEITAGMEVSTATDTPMSFFSGGILIFSSFRKMFFQGEDGEYSFRNGGGAPAINGILDFSNIDTTNKTFTFPNATGNVAVSSGTTGGTASAGAGNQYVELNVGGVVYKVLHDGTV